MVTDRQKTEDEEAAYRAAMDKEKKNELTCDVCKKEFPSKNQLRKHEDQCH